MKTNARYIDNFREQIVNKAIQRGLQVAQVAEETGISRVLLGGWVLNHVKNALHEFEGLDGHKSIITLKDENKRLSRENELLKKMLTFVHLLNKTT